MVKPIAPNEIERISQAQVKALESLMGEGWEIVSGRVIEGGSGIANVVLQDAGSEMHLELSRQGENLVSFSRPIEAEVICTSDRDLDRRFAASWAAYSYATGLMNQGHYCRVQPWQGMPGPSEVKR